MAVVCKRTCSGSLSSMSGSVGEKGLEEVVVKVSGDEGMWWCKVSLCVVASVSSVITLISLVDLVCDLDFSVPKLEVNESADSFSFARAWHPVLHWNTSSVRERTQAWKDTTGQSGAKEGSGTDPRRTVRRTRQCLNCGRKTAPPPPEGPAVARKTNVSWPTVDAVARGGRNTVERQHLPLFKGIGPRVRC